MSRLLLPILLLLSAQLWAATGHDPVSTALEQGKGINGLFGLVDTSALAQKAGLNKSATELLDTVRQHLPNTGVKDFRRYQGPGDKTLLRLNFKPRGVNWLELEFDKNGNLVDWYDYALGVHLSEMVSGIAWLNGQGDETFLDYLNKAPKKALAELASFPRKQRPALAALVLAACGHSACYRYTLRRLQADPDRPPALWQLDQAVLEDHQKEADQVEKALGARLGEDPGWAWLRLARQVGLSHCRKVLNRLPLVVDKWPDYQPLYPLGAQCSASMGKYDQVTSWFQREEKRFHIKVDFNALQRNPLFRPYLQSHSFRQWQSKQ